MQKTEMRPAASHMTPAVERMLIPKTQHTMTTMNTLLKLTTLGALALCLGTFPATFAADQDLAKLDYLNKLRVLEKKAQSVIDTQEIENLYILDPESQDSIYAKYTGLFSSPCHLRDFVEQCM